MSARNATFREHWEIVGQLIKSDGCTVAPDLWFRSCCVMHDFIYRSGRLGGVPTSRLKVDMLFLKCLRASSNSVVSKWILSPLYFVGVRIFGGGYWNKCKGEKCNAL